MKTALFGVTRLISGSSEPRVFVSSCIPVGRTFRCQTFAELEALEHTTGLFLFVDEAGRPLQLESAKVREPGDHHRY
jgi:hypothetical protein